MTTVIIFLTVRAGHASGQDHLKAYPEPKEGTIRHVLILPSKKNETDYRVELVVGKTVETDSANRYFFTGKMKEKTVKGWGYDYFELEELGSMAGTLMAVNPDAPKVKRFITLGGEPRLLRYNSKLPLVVFVPKGVEVRYRLWSAPSRTLPIPPG